MRPYRAKVMKKEGSGSRIEKWIFNMKTFGSKCRYFYQLTLKT